MRACACMWSGNGAPRAGWIHGPGTDLTWALLLGHPFVKTFVVASELSFSPEVESPASLATARDAAPDRVVDEDDVRLRNDTPERPVLACREAAMLAKRCVVVLVASLQFVERLFTPLGCESAKRCAHNSTVNAELHPDSTLRRCLATHASVCSRAHGVVSVLRPPKPAPVDDKAREADNFSDPRRKSWYIFNNLCRVRWRAQVPNLSAL